MTIQWTADLALGIPDLDGQHLALDRQLALVHDAICEDRMPDLSAVLSGVRRCSTRHFECEEAYMEAAKYPALEEHRARHRQFTQELVRLEEARTREGETVALAMEIGNWLARWVREHQRYDLLIAAHVREANRRNDLGKAP